MAMMERDPHTGHALTGHEWNGITELNTAVPRPVWFFLSLALLFSVIAWILLPTWPLGTTYTKGLLEADQRTDVAAALADGARTRAPWMDRIEQATFADIQRDPALMARVRETGPALFGDNCAACHGRDGAGRTGYPNLTTRSWLWGGTPEKIAETIRVGVNSAHPDSRVSQMPAFGRDQVLPRADIEAVVAHVLALRDRHPVTEAGKAVYAAQCAACHGPAGAGNPEVGAPSLVDHPWIYGGDAASVYTTVWAGRQGHMPSWEARLSTVDRKILALWLADRREARR